MNKKLPVETYEEFFNAFIEHMTMQYKIPEEMLLTGIPKTQSAARILLPMANKYRQKCEDFLKKRMWFIVLMGTRVTRKISMALIDIDRLPLNETGLATTLALKEGVYMPPIKVMKKANGRFLIRDGRHRYLAHKLLGRKTIMARMSVKPFRREP